MATGKYLSLEEALKKKQLKRFAKEHPSKGDKVLFDRLFNAMAGVKKPSNPYYVKSGRRYLMRKSNGDCIFFNGGCTIYSDRPMACRLFDCRDYVNHPDLPERVRVEALKRV